MCHMIAYIIYRPRHLLFRSVLQTKPYIPSKPLCVCVSLQIYRGGSESK